MDYRYCGDLATWITDMRKQGSLLEVWIDAGGGHEKVAVAAYLADIIELPNNDYLIGFKQYDKNKHKYSDVIRYYRQSKMRSVYTAIVDQADLEASVPRNLICIENSQKLVNN